ncbi:hypothetical protein [Alicyclobacillus sp. SO9]|uniref:hypothetical protein n=1 Tax=Alicyclobacillus sp. SO9 TaxID=2665646 RepID=UPI0018E8992E|nr:hypothetical protein [Alicyclobacillus sp. SO9]QQE78749.1 hypothetical protein GI364_23355 [Alicyclobacillus sp. SO9]
MKHQLVPPIHAGPAWQYHFLNLSVADMIVVGLMIVVFALAILLPFPGHKEQITEVSDEQPGHGDRASVSSDDKPNGGGLS